MNKYSITKLPIDVLKDVAQKHKQLRKFHNYSQAELATRSGVSLGTVKRFESSGKISFESLLKLAHLLDALDHFDNLFDNSNNSREIEKLFSSKTKLL